VREKYQVFAVLRVDEYYTSDTPIEQKVIVKEIVSTQEIAEREVERLTRINADKRCRYFWQVTRFVELPEQSSSETV
jgi:hypothetical protein